MFALPFYSLIKLSSCPLSTAAPAEPQTEAQANTKLLNRFLYISYSGENTFGFESL
jgi:hypothetical protein